MFGKTDTPSSAPVAATAGHGLRVSGSAELGTGCIFGFHLEAALPLLVHVIAFNDVYAWGMDVSDTGDVACMLPAKCLPVPAFLQWVFYALPSGHLVLPAVFKTS